MFYGERSFSRRARLEPAWPPVQALRLPRPAPARPRSKSTRRDVAPVARHVPRPAAAQRHRAAVANASVFSRRHSPVDFDSVSNLSPKASLAGVRQQFLSEGVPTGAQETGQV